jgi:hypothetical protein
VAEATTSIIHRYGKGKVIWNHKAITKRIKRGENIDSQIKNEKREKIVLIRKK